MREMLQIVVQIVACYLYQFLDYLVDRKEKKSIKCPASVARWNYELCHSWCALVLHCIIITMHNSYQSEKAKEFIELLKMGKYKLEER
jgi:hypothetical protein